MTLSDYTYDHDQIYYKCFVISSNYNPTVYNKPSFQIESFSSPIYYISLIFNVCNLLSIVS